MGTNSPSAPRRQPPPRSTSRRRAPGHLPARAGPRLPRPIGRNHLSAGEITPGVLGLISWRHCPRLKRRKKAPTQGGGKGVETLAAVPRLLVLFVPLRRLRPREQDRRRPALAALEARCTKGCGLLCFLFFLSLSVIVLVHGQGQGQTRTRRTRSTRARALWCTALRAPRAPAPACPVPSAGVASRGGKKNKKP